MTFRSTFCLAPLALACLTSVASAQSVAIAAAGQTFGFPDRCEWQDVRQKLDALDIFDTVDLIDVINDTPTVETLLNYDAILTYTNGSYLDAFTFGDNLAEYVDFGGGVVVAVFANSSPTFGRSIEGRWATEPGYEVIVPRSGNVFEPGELGEVLEPGHPLMKGVATFVDTRGAKPLFTELTEGSRDIALWDDGRTLIAVGPTDKRVDLGFFPPSADCERGMWDPSSDGDRIIANALLFVAVDSCYADCDASGALDFFDFLCFQNLFAEGDPQADCDASGGLDFFDFLCFQEAFAEGCP